MGKEVQFELELSDFFSFLFYKLYKKHKDPYLQLSCFSQVLVCVEQNNSFGENSKSHHFGQK